MLSRCICVRIVSFPRQWGGASAHAASCAASIAHRRSARGAPPTTSTRRGWICTRGTRRYPRRSAASADSSSLVAGLHRHEPRNRRRVRPSSPEFPLLASSEFQLADASSDTAAESATQHWKSSNTRPCPGCASPILKDGGCNHVKCGKCRSE